MMRHAVIGDVGGHVDGLRRELASLGADLDSGLLPRDLTVVQVGDLVHRGPRSEEVVEIVDRFLHRNEGRWVQLVGNHEAQYLRHPAFQWRDWISAEAAARVCSWWEHRDMVAAAVVPCPDGDVLVTHAGVTEEFWRRDLKAPATAREAADRLNELAARGDSALFRGGVMLTGRTSMRAGPLWAEPARELLASWQGRALPFPQVHGHASCFAWSAGKWRANVPDWAIDGMQLDRVRSHERFDLDGGFVVGIDPDHGSQAQPHWSAWQPTPPSDEATGAVDRA